MTVAGRLKNTKNTKKQFRFRDIYNIERTLRYVDYIQEAKMCIIYISWIYQVLKVGCVNMVLHSFLFIVLLERLLVAEITYCAFKRSSVDHLRRTLAAAALR